MSRFLFEVCLYGVVGGLVAAVAWWAAHNDSTRCYSAGAIAGVLVVVGRALIPAAARPAADEREEG